MFCSNCGKEIDDKAVVCIHCGCAVNNSNSIQITLPTQKSLLIALLLWFFLGAFGVHRFYLGDNKGGLLMLVCCLLSWLVIPGLVLVIWWFVDLFKLVTGSLKPADGSKLV